MNDISLSAFADQLQNFFSGGMPLEVMTVIRYALPVLAAVIIYRVIRSLLKDRCEFEEWGYLSLPNGARIPLNHWENMIGRAKANDVYLEYPTLSRSHAAIIRDDKGLWRIYDLNSKGGVVLNGRKVDKYAEIRNGDILNLGGVEVAFLTLKRIEEVRQASIRTRPGRTVKQYVTLLFLTLFQFLLGLQCCVDLGSALDPIVPLGFIALILLTWLCYIATRCMRRTAFEVESLAFFLTTLGTAVTASSVPTDMVKQLVLIVLGIGLYFLLGWFLRDLDRAVKLRWPIAVAGLVLLGVNMLAGTSAFGARNWLSISGISFQPSEFVKIAFVFAGSATMDRLFARRNLYLFVAFAGACVMALALMGDFGTALIFFAAYLAISFIRSGDIATIILSIAGAGFAGFMAVTLKPHVASRFADWGHAWANASAGGFQQTRAMAAAASGGLFGLGSGSGWLKHVFAANTDLVFAMVCEEMGLIIAVLAIVAVVVLALHAVRSSSTARSSYYVIGSCAAATILLFQVLLNVFGSVDILPFTGVTFPFVSKGGTSLIASWGLLAFIKASDTRQNASFILKTTKRATKQEKQLAQTYGDSDDEQEYNPGDDGFDYNHDFVDDDDDDDFEGVDFGDDDGENDYEDDDDDSGGDSTKKYTK